jgi:glycosyltransferase involved in cell wall biosynthesis
MSARQGTLTLKIDANVQVKDEALLLEEVLPEWDSYPIDHFVFYDDGSTDGTREVIEEQLESDRFTILADPDLEKFHEAHNRSAMLEHSRENKADVVISIDADELLTEPFLDHFDEMMTEATKYKLYTFQWNLVDGMTHYRTDPAYFGNYRDFIFPMASTGKFDMSLGQYHSPRTPPIDLSTTRLPDDYGFVHLQSVDVGFYALKQLWYKTFEYVEYGKSPAEINAGYDPVVNGLDFCAADLPSHILFWDTLDTSVFARIAEQRGWIDYINEYSVPELITFGEEYL